jgi:CheY-like chemotaxis protein
MAKTILLADDSITIQKIVNLTFSGEGIEVVTVNNGDAAIKKVHEIDPDLVLADIFMPGKNGYEVCEYIKGQAEVQRIPVILLVGAFEPFDSNEATRVKADGHLTKPFEIKVLISAVNSLISAAEEEKTEDTGTTVKARPDAGASSEIEVGAPVVVQDTVVSELPSSTVAPAFLEGDPPATEGIVVDLNQDVKQSPELEASEPIIVLKEGQNHFHPSVGTEDLDPLGLSAGLAEAVAATPSDSKELVVDIWESRSSSPSRVAVLPETSEPGAPVQAAGPAVVFQEPPHSASPAVANSATPISYVDGKTAGLSQSEPSSDRGLIPSAEDGPKAKKPAVSAQADSTELVDMVVQRVMERLSREVIEKIAWEVVPDLAEIIIKEQTETHFRAPGRV